jgi:hydrogenase maturation protease
VNDRVLVAGVGNIFLGDDGFGSEVARRLSAEAVPDGVTVIDFGIGGIHLAYELQEGYGTVILVDASPCGEEPGTVSVIEIDRGDTAVGSEDLPVAMAGALADGHAMEPDSVLDRISALGVATQVLVVGCEPADTGERIGLSPPVHRAVDEAVGVVLGLLRELAGSTSPVVSAPGPSDGPSARRES